MERITYREPVASPRAALRVTHKALPEHNRRNNRSLVLQTLFHAGAMSRADLARESGLTRVTISDLVAELASEGLVAELGTRTDARVGKPATLVGIQDDAFHLIAVDLSAADTFVGAVTNLRGEEVRRIAKPLDGATGDAAVALVRELCRELADSASVRLLGVGIGTPGLVDHEGVVLEAPNLGWANVRLADILREELQLPVHVANDANAAALAIHTFEPSGGRSVMVVTLEHGVGSGLIIGGSLVEGEQFAAGEIGHVVVDEDGELCSCGRRGCLELSLAAPRLRASVAGLDGDARDAALAAAGRSLGIVLAPIVSALNLNEVVLTGRSDLIGGALLDSARDTVRARTLSAVSNGLNLHLAADGGTLVLRGAAVLVLSAELGVS